MQYCGFDLAKVASQICIRTEDAQLIERRIRGLICDPAFYNLPEALEQHQQALQIFQSLWRAPTSGAMEYAN